MKKSFFLVISFIVALLYWMLDAYANALLYGSSFVDELLLQSPHSLSFIKFSIVLLIFSLGFLFPTLNEPEEEPPCVHELESLENLSEILFSSFSDKVNIIKALEKLTDILKIDASILFIYTIENIVIYNENPIIKTLFHAKEIYPFRTNATQSDAEQIAINCFLEKRPFSENTITLEKQDYTLFSFILKEEKSGKVFGNLMLVARHKIFIANNIQMIKKAVQMFTFALSVSVKKEQLLEASEKYILDQAPFDTALNIMNPVKFQEYIVREFKRNRRYSIELTLILIEINTLNNLNNVFAPEIILNLKKDFCSLVQKNIREVDIFSKWNNDQFAILLPHTDFRGGQGLAKKIQRLLDAYKFNQIGKINCSFGITSLSPKDTVGTFKIRSESALALAVSKGGNAIEVKLLA